jgi:hypothetical protein
MIINVVGGTKVQRKHARSMVEFCVATLMPKMKTLDIEVKLCKLDNALGYCLETDNKRTFEIEIHRTQSLRKLLETVAHEMVHVKQYARRELHPADDVWMGKTYNPKKISYWDLPWEIEAHGREVGLFIRYCETHKLGKQKWTQDK